MVLQQYGDVNHVSSTDISNNWTYQLATYTHHIGAHLLHTLRLHCHFWGSRWVCRDSCVKRITLKQHFLITSISSSSQPSDYQAATVQTCQGQSYWSGQSQQSGGFQTTSAGPEFGLIKSKSFYRPVNHRVSETL